MFFDAHCDTILKLRRNEPFDFSFKKASSSGGFFQIFACYCESDKTDLYEAERMIKRFTSYINSIPDAEIVYSAGHAKETLCSGKVAAMLSLENCVCLGDNPENLYRFYNLGVRSIGLTWNGDNAFAHGCLCKNGGLTKCGKELIELAEKLGILIDVSHLNRKSFWDVLNLGKGKIFASHSSSYNINPNPRNLTDKQILALYDRGGVVCTCPYPPFVNGTNTAEISEFMAHLKHISDLTDSNGVGIGSDMDGVKFNCTNLKNTADFLKLPSLCRQYGFADYEIQNIFSCNLGNFLNIFPKK